MPDVSRLSISEVAVSSPWPKLHHQPLSLQAPQPCFLIQVSIASLLGDFVLAWEVQVLCLQTTHTAAALGL